MYRVRFASLVKGEWSYSIDWELPLISQMKDSSSDGKKTHSD